MILRLPLGRERVMVDLRGFRVQHLRPSVPQRRGTLESLLAAALTDPIGCPSLEEICRHRTRIAVVVPDATRKAEIPDLLPALLQRIRSVAPAAKVAVVVACGTHPRPGDEVLREILGPLPAGVQVHCHDSRDRQELVAVGELEPGRPLRLNRLVVEAEAVITVGAVRHHYFAGFGGGPKMLFPGCAGHDEIQHNHSHVVQLDAHDWRLDPGCAPGVLDGNAVAEEIARGADMRPPDMAICLVCDEQGSVAWVRAGSWRPCFAAAVRRVREWFEVPAQRFRYLVACGGGHPSDHTLIQAHKGLDAACRFLEPNGQLLYLASLAGGVGAEAMVEFVTDPVPSRIIERLRERWIQYGHTTLRIVDKTSRYQVWLHSQLDSELTARLGFRAVRDPESVVQEWRERDAGAAVGVISGAAVYPSGKS